MIATLTGVRDYDGGDDDDGAAGRRRTSPACPYPGLSSGRSMIAPPR